MINSLAGLLEQAPPCPEPAAMTIYVPASELNQAQGAIVELTTSCEARNIRLTVKTQ
jgi:hypothetical protein